MKKITALDWISNNIKSEDLNEGRANLGLNKRVQKKYEDNTIEDVSSSVAVLSPEDFKAFVYKEMEIFFIHEKMTDHSDLTANAIDHSIENAVKNDIRTPSYLLRFYGGMYNKRWDEYEYIVKIAIYIDKNEFSYSLTYNGRSVIDMNGYEPSNAHPLTMSELEKAIKTLRKYLQISRAKEFNESSLGLNKHVQKKFQDIDAVDNVSPIQFKDQEVERICHEHEVFYNDDAAEVSSIKEWFTEKENIKSFNELKFFTGLKTIEDEAFYYCTSLQSVTIPSSVTSIGRSAFSHCKALQSVTISNSVTSIGRSAFSRCMSLQSVTISNSVTSIGNSAFNECKSLRSISIPDSVTDIGDFAFCSCDSLQSINIPSSVTSIGDGAFYECKSLQSISIPDSVTGIGEAAFYDCGSLQSIYISKNCPVYKQIRKAYPAIQLIEPKVNEASSLGLNKHVQKKFQDVDAIDNISDYVDLGLPSGTLWCKHNYDTDEEYEYGGYYTFDEAQKIDGVPSKEDFEELHRCCDNEWVSVNGVYGRRFVSKVNKKSVFFPAGGQRVAKKSIWNEGVAGNYWSTSKAGSSNRAYCLAFGEASVNPSYLFGKYYELPLRTVKKKMEESSLGLNKHVQKKYDDKNAVEEVTKSFVSSLADFKKYIKDTFDELYKDDPKKIIKLYNSSSVACGGSSVATVTFDEYTDLTGHFFSPRFYMVYGYNEQTGEIFSYAELDFRTDTSGSGNLNSRKFYLYGAKTTPESVENLSVCLKNIKKIAGKPADFYPAQYSKKAYETLVNGFCTGSYNPKPAAKEAYINREDLISYLTSKPYYGHGLDFVKAFTDLYDGYVRIDVKVVCDFKNMNDREFVDHMKQYISHRFLADFGGTMTDQDILQYKKTYDKLSKNLWRIEVIDATKQKYIIVIFNPDIHRIKDISTIKEIPYVAESRMFEDVLPETIKADKDKYRKVYTALYGSTEGSPMFNQYVDEIMTFIGRNKRTRVFKSMVERIKPEV